MDLLANVPNWDEIERNLDYKFGELNQSISQGWQNAQDGWDGFTRRVNTQFDRTYGQLGGDRINAVREALYRADPIILMNLKQRWASIEIDQVLDVLRQLVKEVSMILGGSIWGRRGTGSGCGRRSRLADRQSHSDGNGIISHR